MEHMEHITNNLVEPQGEIDLFIDTFANIEIKSTYEPTLDTFYLTE
jgi:hypothetical protein